MHAYANSPKCSISDLVSQMERLKAWVEAFLLIFSQLAQHLWKRLKCKHTVCLWTNGGYTPFLPFSKGIRDQEDKVDIERRQINGHEKVKLK